MDNTPNDTPQSEEDVDEARDALLIGIATVLYEMHRNDILAISLRTFMRFKLQEWGDLPDGQEEQDG